MPLIVVLVLLFGCGGYLGYLKWGAPGSLGVISTFLAISLALFLAGALR